MELDLKFKQYELIVNDVEKIVEDGVFERKSSRPFQEVIDFFDEGSNTIFSYNELMKALKNVGGKQEIVLSNGAKLFIQSGDGLVNIGIMYPDKTKFVGCWSNIADNSEFVKKSCEMAQKK